MDKEFQQITPDAEIGKRLADQLVKVHRQRGKEMILLLHLEVQGTPEKAFPERMFIYSVRIFEYFHQPPVSLAILCDGKSDWRPASYGFQTVGSSLQFEFTSIKLLDYQSQWSALEQSRNPFALVVMTHLKNQETKRNANDRKIWKFTLVKRLYKSGYSRSDVLNLFKFVDWLMILPEGLKQAFWEELKAYEEERKMPYITSVEQIGYDRGEAEGAKRQAQSLVLRLLTRKFGNISEQMLDRVNALEVEQLESLAEALLDFGSIEDLSDWLNEQG